MHTISAHKYVSPRTRPLTPEEAEVRRIDVTTRAPDILAELKAALSNDPARFARRLSKLVLELAQTGRTITTPVRLMPELVRGETV